MAVACVVAQRRGRGRGSAGRAVELIEVDGAKMGRSPLVPTGQSSSGGGESAGGGRFLESK